MSKKTYLEYKDSGIDWIGEMPTNWKLEKLKHILKERNIKNNPIKTNEILSLTAKQGVIPLSEKEHVGGNKPKDDLTQYKLAFPNDIVLNSMNIISGAVGLSNYYGCVSPVYYMFYSDNKNINVEYYNYIFQIKSFQRMLLKFGKGILIRKSDNGKLNTIRMKIPMDSFKDLELPLLDIETQNSIVSYLNHKVSTIEQKISKNEELIQLLEEKRVALINQVVTKGLNPDVPMKDSGVEWIGEMPEHWNVVKLKFCTNVINDKKDFADKDDKYIGLEHIESETGILLDYSNEGADGTVNKFKKDMVLFGKLRPYLAKVINTSFNGVCSTELLVFKTNESLLSRYLFYFMLSNRFIEQVNSSTYGVKMPRASPDFINSLPIALPNTNEQKEVVDYLDSEITNINNTILKIKENIALLEEYKTSLIHHVVTGKIDVRGEEI